VGLKPDTASMKNVPEMEVKVFGGEKGCRVNLADLGSWAYFLLLQSTIGGRAFVPREGRAAKQVVTELLFSPCTYTDR
jgi:hypothetical protein